MNFKAIIKKCRLFQLVCCMLLTQAATAQPFIIKGDWKLSFGDKMEFSKPDYDDSIDSLNLDQVTIEANNIRLKKVDTPLPKGWVGNQKFQLKAFNNNVEKEILLVPYADAGKTSGVIGTWLKLKK